MLPEGLVAYLLAQTPIVAVIDDRLQPIPAPEDLSQYPLIVYQVVSDVPQDYSFDGPSGVTEMRIVFDCLANRYLDARVLARALKTVLNGFAGDLPDGTHIYLVRPTLVDRFDDGSRIWCTSVHALIQYED